MLSLLYPIFAADTIINHLVALPQKLELVMKHVVDQQKQKVKDRKLVGLCSKLLLLETELNLRVSQGSILRMLDILCKK